MMSKALQIVCWVTAGVLIVGCSVFLLPYVFTSACQSSPMTTGLIWLHHIHLAQLEVHKGFLGAENTGGVAGYWRKDIRGLDTTTVNGNPARLISNRLAELDVGGTVTNVNPTTSEISLRALRFSGEPPFDYSKYAVVMWVREWGRMGLWTLILSQDGVWGKPGMNDLDHFPADPLGEGWLPEEEVKRILSKSKRSDHLLSFWGMK